jgi:hypothetical protein
MISHIAPPKSTSFFADFGMDSGFPKKAGSNSSKVRVCFMTYNIGMLYLRLLFMVNVNYNMHNAQLLDIILLCKILKTNKEEGGGGVGSGKK